MLVVNPSICLIYTAKDEKREKISYVLLKKLLNCLMENLRFVTKKMIAINGMKWRGKENLGLSMIYGSN